MMSKEFQFVKAGKIADVQRHPIDWKVCILCQKETSEPLLQPWKRRGRGKSEGKGTGYQSFASNLAKFKDLGNIPLNVCPNQFDDGPGLEETLQRNHANWGTCRNMFSDLKLERQKKRMSQRDSSDSCATSHVKLRQSSSQSSGQDVPVCFFCDKEAGPAGLHEVATMGMNQTIRKYATELKDTTLLAKLAPAEKVALDAKYHKKCLCDLYNRQMSYYACIRS